MSMDCPNLAACPFVKYCKENNATTSVNGFILMYCQGERQSACVRKQLCEKFGKQVVPKDMMPNGLPLPGSVKEGWSEEALDYRNKLSH